jgi:hypothetical protein
VLGAKNCDSGNKIQQYVLKRHTSVLLAIMALLGVTDNCKWSWLRAKDVS